MNDASQNYIQTQNCRILSLKQTMLRLISFSLPIISNNLLGIIPTLASIWILARLGKDQLAAAAIATPTFYTILAIFITGFSAVGIKVSHSFGGNKNSLEIEKWVKNGLFLAVLLSVPAMVILFNIHFYY